MKKKFIGVTTLAVGLALASAMTAFAGSWKADALGTYYENDDGTRPVYGGWFTDPDTGATYYMDPDAYIMTETEVLGYWLAADGKRVEKSEEELAAEAEKEAIATASKLKKSPAAAASAAKAAGKAAKNADYAVSTTRLSYQSEMTVFMNNVFTAAGKATTTAGIIGDSERDNIQVTYYFSSPDGYRYFTAVQWFNSKETSLNYRPQALDLTYNYNSMGGDDATLYGDAFHTLVLAALGPEEGQAVVDALTEARENGTESFTRDATTDTGNYYSLKYTNGYVEISVICSEIDPEEALATDSNAEAAETTEATAETESASTSVIAAGESTTDTATEETVASAESAEGTEEAATEETVASEESAETTEETTAEEAAAAEQGAETTEETVAEETAASEEGVETTGETAVSEEGAETTEETAAEETA